MKKQAKTFITTSLILMMTFSLCACGYGFDNSKSQQKIENAQADVQQASAETPEQANAETEQTSEQTEEQETVVENEQVQNEEEKAKEEQTEEPKKEILSIDEIKTCGDLLSLKDNFGCSIINEELEYTFELNGSAYKAKANLKDDVQKQLNELDIWDDNYDQKCNDILSSIPIDELINLTKDYPFPTQEELSKYIGKPAQSLLDDGFTYRGSVNDTCIFEKDVWRFTVILKDAEDLFNTMYEMDMFEREAYIASLIIDGIEATDYV